MKKESQKLDNINIEIFKLYYSSHTRAETANYFNISETSVKNLCAKLNWHKDKCLIYTQIAANNLKKYGVKTTSQLLEIKAKIGAKNKKYININWEELKTYYATHSRAETCIKFNINESSFKKICKQHNYIKQSNNIVENRIKTNLLKYGSQHYTQTLAYHKKAKKQYKFENEFFDSIPELAIFIYCKQNNIYVQRAPKKFEYIYNGQVHSYIPDFNIAGKLVEIKGDHFFKEDGTMCNPFDHSQDALYEAKHQCGLKNNVEFWTRKKYNFALQYLKQKNININTYLVKEITYENQ